jgi:pyruvate kinase
LIRPQALARDFELDFLSLSYVRCEEDIHEARAFLASIGSPSTKLLAKVRVP